MPRPPLLAFVVLPLALSCARCHMTAAQAALLESAAAGAACRLLPLAGPDIPQGIDAAVCALADGVTPAPESVAVVKAKVVEVTSKPAVREEATMVHGHGVVRDRRAVMGVGATVR